MKASSLCAEGAVEALTARLVRRDSVSSTPTAAVAQVVLDALQELGAEVRIQDVPRGGLTQTNVLGRVGGGTHGLLLAGHLDTVPWTPGQRATLEPHREGTRLYGRGTCDMKGGIAAELVGAARALVSAPLRCPLWFGFTFEEEVGCHGARFAADAGWLGARSAIVAEPTGLAPVTVHKGYWEGRVEVHGRAGHSSEPDRAVSAIEAATAVSARLFLLRDALRQQAGGDPGLHPPFTTLNVGRIEGGTAANVVPESCRVTVELRPLPGTDLDGLIRRVQAAVDSGCAAVPGSTATVRTTHTLSPFRARPEDPLVVFLRERTGQEPRGVPFATEAPIYQSFAPSTVVCGPGSIAQAHREDEYVDVDDLEAAADLYADAVRAFCR